MNFAFHRTSAITLYYRTSAVLPDVCCRTDYVAKGQSGICLDVRFMEDTCVSRESFVSEFRELMAATNRFQSCRNG